MISPYLLVGPMLIVTQILSLLPN